MSRGTAGVCPSCQHEILVRLIGGMNDVFALRCNRCGTPGLVDVYDPRVEEIRRFEGGAFIQPEAVEKNLEPCTCGGHFLLDAPPRCPHCHVVLEDLQLRQIAGIPVGGTYEPCFMVAEPVKPAWVRNYAV